MIPVITSIRQTSATSNPEQIELIQEKGMISREPTGTDEDLRDTRASVLLRIAIPPGDEVKTARAIAAVPGIREGDER